jgi:hypothetical protein
MMIYQQVIGRLPRWALFALLMISMYGAPGCDAVLDNKGTEFILGFMRNGADSWSHFLPNIELHITADVTTDVEVEYPLGTSIETRTVNAGTVEVVSLPMDASTLWITDGVLANLIRATAEQEFVVYMINAFASSSDAALGLPVDTMNTEYIVLDYDPFAKSRFLVYAAFDNTVITITPSNNLVGSHSAGEPFEVQLNRGEGYYAQSASTNTLTGTTISSTLPVGMVNGNACANVPTGTSNCDTLFQVAQPVQTWGLEIGVANLPQRAGGSIYRVVASENSTEVTLDGSFLANLDVGDFFETDIIPGNHVFRGDKPIFVAQYMTGAGSPSAVGGDPSMGNMIPFAQYLSAYTFSTVGGGLFSFHYVTIIAKNEDIGSVLLDNVAVSSGSFSAIPGTDYSAAVLSIGEGTHSTTSPNPHGITVVGLNKANNSYLYPGGTQLEFINAVSPITDFNPPNVTLDLPIDGYVYGLAEDNREDDTGIFSIELSPDSSANLEIKVANFTEGDTEVNFIVQLVADSDSRTTSSVRLYELMTADGDVIVTDGVGNNTTVPVSIPLLSPSLSPSLLPSASSKKKPKTTSKKTKKSKGKGA